MKKENLELVIIFTIFLVLCVGIIMLIINDIVETKKEDDNLCKKIAIKKEMQFLESAEGKCGSGISCEFQCRLLNKNGDVIIVNYP